MKFEVADTRKARDEKVLIDSLRQYNDQFVGRDTRPLSVYCRTTFRRLAGGLSADTHGEYLDIYFLWVAEEHRRSGIGAQLVSLAESRARERGCRFSQVDTFSFQALGFYQKLGYEIFGSLDEYFGSETRYYLVKRLAE